MIPMIKNDRIIKILQKVISRRTAERVKSIALKLHPGDLATVIPYLTADDLAFYISVLYSIDLAGKTIIELNDIELLTKVLKTIDDDKLARIIEKVQSDDAVDFLGLLSEDRKESILQILNKYEYEELLSYPEDSCGGIMTKEFFALDEIISVEEATEIVKNNPKKETAFYLYVTDESGHLTGILSLRSLIINDSKAIIKEVMVSDVIRVHPEDTQTKAAALISKYDFLALPVVDNKNKLIGVITVDDVIDIIEEEANEELLHLAGVDVDETLTTPSLKSVKYRLPWLAINLVTALLAASIIDSFQYIISQYVALAVFLPVIGGMGGNSAMQIMSITVRQISFMRLDKKDFFSVIGREIIVAAINGLIIGLLLGGIAYFYYQDVNLLYVCLISLFLNTMIANTAGFVVPFVIKKLGKDPATASSIFVTTFTDMFGFFVFLTLAKIFLKL